MLDLFNLLFYCIQQLGVMLGVGAETIVLLAFLLSIRDGVVDDEEERFAHAVKKVLYIGIVCILISGIPITALEFYAGQGAIVFAPAYLFKTILIVIVLGLALFTKGSTFQEGLLQGLAGGTWYALFVVHILAPVATWSELWTLYGWWIAGFLACWMVAVFTMQGRSTTVSTFHPQAANKAKRGIDLHVPAFLKGKHTSPAPHGVGASPSSAPAYAASQPQQSPNLAPIRPTWQQPARPAPVQATLAPQPQQPTPAMAQPPAGTPRTGGDQDLPRVRVMPKTLADLQKQNRVIFN